VGWRTLSSGEAVSPGSGAGLLTMAMTSSKYFMSCRSAYGYRPTAHSDTMSPIAQMSAGNEYALPSMRSGAM
jgi:hypothetical protein